LNINIEAINPSLKSSLIAAICLFILPDLPAQSGTKKFTFDDFFKNNTFSVTTSRGLRSMKDGGNYIASEDRGTKLVVHSYRTGDAVKTLLDLKNFTGSQIKSISDFAFSNDENKILLYIDKEAIYRRSFTANYFIYDIVKQTLNPLSLNGKQQSAAFSPDGSKVAFVRKNNLFYCDLNTGKEVQVTNDGLLNHIINGVPDWVYEEEF